MESNDRQQRQNNPQGYTGQQGLLQHSQQYPQSSNSERFRQPTLQQLPTSTSTNRRGTDPRYLQYGYGDNQHFVGPQMQPGSLQYPPEYSESNRAQQQQQQQPQQPQNYGQFSANLMYNVAQQQNAGPPASPYEQIQSFQQQSRQSANIDAITNQFGVPQPFYVSNAGVAGPSGGQHPAIASQTVPQQYGPLNYTQQSPVPQSRGSIGSAYAGQIPDASPAQAPGSASGPTQSTQQGGQGFETQSSSDFDAAYGQYQTELRRTNESVRDGRLSEAGSALLSISEWLLSNAQTLGLVRDDESVQADRLRLWEDFNNCWLVTLQKQKDMTRESIRTGQSPQQPQSLIDRETLERMGNEIVRLCDTIEKHGLVDYQMGVWEEDILNLLGVCLDLKDQSAAATANPRPSGSRRR